MYAPPLRHKTACASEGRSTGTHPQGRGSVKVTGDHRVLGNFPRFQVVILIGKVDFGFFGKFLIFQDALGAGLTVPAIVLAASSVVSVYYYLMIAMKAFVEEEGGPRPAMRISMPVRFTAILCIAGILLAGIFTSPLTHCFFWASQTPEALARRLPSGLKTTLVTWLECPCKERVS